MLRSLRATLASLVLAACPCTCNTSEAAPDPPAARITTERVATYTVKAMSCHGCAKTVETLARKQDGVRDVRVDLGKQRAVVTFDAATITSETIRRAIEAAGFRASLVEERAGERKP